MSRIGITYQEVIEAITKLQERGKIPTVDRIRNHLGTGSNSTISRYLREWKSEGVLSGADTVPSDLIAIVKELWARLQEKADQQISTLTIDTAKTVQAIEAKFIQVQKENVELQTKTHKLEENLYLKTEENTVINKTATALQLELSKLHDRYITLEKQRNDQKVENTKLHELLNNVQKNLEHYQSSIQKLQQEQLIIIEKQAAKYEQEIVQLKQELVTSISEKEKFKLLSEQTSSMLKKTERSLEITTKSLREKEINEATLQDRYSRLAQQYEANVNVLEIKTNLLAEAVQKLEIKTIQELELQQALRDSKDKVKTLRHEQLFLVQEKANFEGQLKQFQKLNSNKDNASVV
jgi:hypothetical protein